ncbi:hypothetical protein CYL18_06830 [Pradoshia eiseniae]|uniref:Uncharacterized protein n=1 Tax=Pradoshia eiseniae TaxID=2064768 RepID=A0A2S7N0N4_9BACI|nr:hypothetical protein [Pradoshia eiseniae]PQD95604.1 hypothetical protein CYL18_06830 [Pradoshia eiseniae]
MYKENGIEAYEAYNRTELLAGLEVKSDYILIKGDYYKDIKKVMDTQPPENESIGVALGSAGMLSILIYAINAVRISFSKADKTDKIIEKKLNSYKIKRMTDDGLLLSLKQLDY